VGGSATASEELEHHDDFAPFAETNVFDSSSPKARGPEPSHSEATFPAPLSDGFQPRQPHVPGDQFGFRPFSEPSSTSSYLNNDHAAQGLRQDMPVAQMGPERGDQAEQDGGSARARRRQFEWETRSPHHGSDGPSTDGVSRCPNSPGLSLGDAETEEAAIALEDMALGRSTYTPLGLNTDVPLVGSARELAPQVMPALADLSGFADYIGRHGWKTHLCLTQPA
jgi:hypothetical protein